MSEIEDIIRRIVREEIAKQQPVPLPVYPHIPGGPKSVSGFACPKGTLCRGPGVMCADSQCAMRVNVAYTTGAPR